MPRQRHIAAHLMDDLRIERGGDSYPIVLLNRLGDATPPVIHAIGNVSALRSHRLGLICSIQCPGSVIIKTYDAIRELRDAGSVVVGGFHSPMERECLDLLLRGTQPVILCAARKLQGLRMGKEARRAVEEGRLLVLSPFGDDDKRTTSAHAVMRNEFVAALADAVLIPHASPGGKTAAIASKLIARGQTVYTFDVEENASLMQVGAKPYELSSIRFSSKSA